MWWTCIAGLALASAPPDLAALACAGRAPCQQVADHDAGVDPEGAGLRVVRVALADGDPASLEGPRYGDPCVPFEWHLFRVRDGAVVGTELILEACNDGYGAAGVGEDVVEVGPNRFSHAQSGGSAWRWSQGEVVQLWPRRTLARDSFGGWTLGPNQDASSVDYVANTASGTFFVPRCAEIDADDAPDPFGWVGIPVVPADAAAWRNGPGPVAARVDASGQGGFVVYGDPGAASDAALSVAFHGDRTLAIEIRDDTWVRRAKSWVRADHVEIWAGPAIDYGQHCVESVGGAVQWGVPVADGAAIAASGASGAVPEVERAWDGEVLRMRVALPAVPERITVVYSDSDTGKQERLIATSAVVFGDARSLGRTFAPDVAPR